MSLTLFFKKITLQSSPDPMDQLKLRLQDVYYAHAEYCRNHYNEDGSRPYSSEQNLLNLQKAEVDLFARRMGVNPLSLLSVKLGLGTPSKLTSLDGEPVNAADGKDSQQQEKTVSRPNKPSLPSIFGGSPNKPSAPSVFDTFR